MVRWDEYAMNPIALIFPTTHLLDFAKLRSLVSDDRANCSGHDVACSAYCPDHTKYDICIRMSKLERITVTMPAEMAAKLRAAVERGEYATTSEVVREALRDWSDEQERVDRDNTAIRAMLDSARAGGRIPADAVFAQVPDHVAKVASEELARRGA